MSQEDYNYKEALKRFKEKRGGASPELLERYKTRRKQVKEVKNAIKNGKKTVPDISEATGIPMNIVQSVVTQLRKYENLVMVDKRSEYPIYDFKEGSEK